MQAAQPQQAYAVEVGVLLDETPTGPGLLDPSDPDETDAFLDGDLGDDDPGHTPAWGRRGRHAVSRRQLVAQVGQDVLRAAAEAVGNEVALVVSGVTAGIERRRSADGTGAPTGSFDIQELELKFGVKATLGAGKAVEAFLTATGEATVEVTLRLRPCSDDR